MTRRGMIVALSLTSIAVAGAGLYRFVRHGAGEKPGDFPEGLHFVCSDTSCRGRASLSTAELDAHLQSHPESDPSCPACGKPMTRAIRCESCRELLPRPARDGDATCPRCAKPLVTPR